MHTSRRHIRTYTSIHTNTCTHSYTHTEIHKTHVHQFTHSLSIIPVKPMLCKSNEFRCHDNLACLPLLWRCDGRPECLDQSDEYKCDEKRSLVKLLSLKCRI